MAIFLRRSWEGMAGVSKEVVCKVKVVRNYGYYLSMPAFQMPVLRSISIDEERRWQHFEMCPHFMFFMENYLYKKGTMCDQE
jgi:hypothetical protein